MDPASRPSSPSIIIKSKKYEVAKKTKKPPDKGEPQLEMSISKMSLNESSSSTSRSGSAKSRKGSAVSTNNGNNKLTNSSSSKLTKFFSKTKLIKSTADNTAAEQKRVPSSVAAKPSRFNFRKKSIVSTDGKADGGLVKKVRALVSRKESGKSKRRVSTAGTTPVMAFDKFGGSEPHLPASSTTPYGFREAVSVMSLSSSATASSKG